MAMVVPHFVKFSLIVDVKQVLSPLTANVLFNVGMVLLRHLLMKNVMMEILLKEMGALQIARLSLDSLAQLHLILFQSAQ